MIKTNVILTDEQHRDLRARAKQQGRTIAALVREAIDIFHSQDDLLEHRRSVALNAYKEGFISLGKLAEVLGMDPISTRSYLKQQRIGLFVQDSPELLEDVANA